MTKWSMHRSMQYTHDTLKSVLVPSRSLHVLAKGAH